MISYQIKTKEMHSLNTYFNDVNSVCFYYLFEYTHILNYLVLYFNVFIDIIKRCALDRRKKNRTSLIIVAVKHSQVTLKFSFAFSCIDENVSKKMNIYFAISHFLHFNLSRREQATLLNDRELSVNGVFYYILSSRNSRAVYAVFHQTRL